MLFELKAQEPRWLNPVKLRCQVKRGLLCFYSLVIIHAQSVQAGSGFTQCGGDFSNAFICQPQMQKYPPPSPTRGWSSIGRFWSLTLKRADAIGHWFSIRFSFSCSCWQASVRDSRLRVIKHRLRNFSPVSSSRLILRFLPVARKNGIGRRTFFEISTFELRQRSDGLNVVFVSMNSLSIVYQRIFTSLPRKKRKEQEKIINLAVLFLTWKYSN